LIIKKTTSFHQANETPNIYYLANTGLSLVVKQYLQWCKV